MTAYRNAVNYVADPAHETWRAKWRATNGDAPRWKPMNQDSLRWLCENDVPTSALRQTEVGFDIDIAALTNGELPPQFSGENVSAAEGAIDAVLQNQKASLDDLAAVVHMQWVERKLKAGETPPAELAVDFKDLPDIDQEKDRVIARLALDAVERFGLLLIQSGR